MKRLLALSLILPNLVGTALADEAVVRANCTSEIVKTTDATRSNIKSFRVAKSGKGYEMSGQTDENRTVTCSTDPDGRVLWVTQR